MADLTVTVAVAKQGLVADSAIQHVGRLALVPLPDLAPDPEAGPHLLTPDLLRPWLPRRAFDFHKGQAGRIGLIAGSAGYFGAAILACAGALRAGGGLVTLLVKEDAYPMLAAKAPPEVMVKLVKDYREALDLPFNALGIGPGIGLTAETEILEIIRTALLPCIIDADAITLLARGHSSILAESPAPRLLTPHPGEMQRLMPGIQQETRLTQVQLAATRFTGHTVLLKGARTLITTAGGATFFNTTGHPGMATGGMGDVLTGVCAALSAQGIPLPHTAGLAAWSCGRAAEIAALTIGQNAVLPSDVAAHLGASFQELG
jgi:NAD(P)H-hydrate epimerase